MAVARQTVRNRAGRACWLATPSDEAVAKVYNLTADCVIIELLSFR
jgi:hypothetical protein